MPRFGRRGKGSTDDTPTVARDEDTSEVEQAVQQRRADDAPDPVTTEPDASDATEIAGTQEIDAKFEGQDFGIEEQLADMIGQTGGDEDALASFAGIDTAFGAAGRDRLADIAADLAPDDGQQDGPRYGKDMIAGDKDQSVVSGHPGAYGVVWKDGEVAGHYAASPVDDDGMFLGIDVGAMAYEKEMNRKAEEVAQQRGSGSGTGSGSGSGSGSATPPPTTNPNGPNTTTDDAGTNTTTDPVTGDTYVTNPDGSQAVIHPDGSMDLYDKDGNHVEHQDPPPADPPAEDPPAEDPPAEDPPAEDPPAEDPPAEDPPKADTESHPDEDYVDPEVEALLRAELAENPGYAYYQQQRGADGAVDPADDEIAFQVAPGTAVPDARARGHEMFGQPADEGFGHDNSPSDNGYWNDPNHGAIDPGDDEVITGGPQRNDDPLDGAGPDLEPVAESDDAADDGVEFLPPSSEIAGPVHDPGADLPDVDFDEPAP